MSGLAFRKIDLHVHTPGSHDFNRPAGMSDLAIAEAIVNEALNKALDAIAITDHNSGEWVDNIKEVARGKLVVFPGVELTCEGGAGIHILAILDPTKGTQDVRSLLSRLNLDSESYGKDTALIRKSPTDVIREVSRFGAIPLLVLEPAYF